MQPVQALLIIDVQLGSLAVVPESARLLERVGELLAKARAAGVLIVHVQNDGVQATADAPGTPGWELHFGVEAGEPVVRKLQDDSFAGTPLAELLAAHEVQAVAVCGLMSEMCVSATARTALARGLRVVLPHDAHSTTGIPATAAAPAISAETVSRVADWALGDELEAVEHASEVSFSR
ncbi:isochorismatase family protein [Kribbella sp. NPDC051718]|uniref:isochorismatase family protein n=1 Tax=Kribbella sp. NPDC051718 TaxID=3155168 RepID=UPI003446E36B